MKTKVLAALAATMAVGATCAFAANPFVDVPSDSWAYKSVVELADAGIIQGVDGQYFNMTAELFEALLDKNAVVIGSSVFEGPMSEHPEIEEAKKNGTWGVDENKPAATAKPAAAAAVTPVRSSIPKTSDDSNLMLWVCLMGIAALGLGGAVYMKKRNHQ